MNYLDIKGQRVWFNPEHLILLKRHNWHISKTGYACTTIQKRIVPMHLIIMGSPKVTGLEVDHVNRNKLDNQDQNLRWVNRGKNSQNSPGRGASKYRGVHANGWGSPKRPWRAMIKREHLGVFETEEEAAKAYDQRAIQIYGDQCFLNFPCEVGV